MTGVAGSFELRTRAVWKVVDAAVTRARELPEASGLLFLTGDIASQIEEVAQELSQRRDCGHWLLAAVPGVLTERGEIEQESAAVGMLFPNSRARILTSPSADKSFGQALGDQLAQAPGASVLVLMRGDRAEDEWLAALDHKLGNHEERFFGGGTIPRHDLFSVEPGRADAGAAGALLLQRPWVGRVASSSACRLLSPLTEVNKMRGSMMLELEGLPALDVLTQSTQNLDEQQLVLLAIAADDKALSPEGRNLALRAIHGVDPAAGGILLGDELPEGSRVAFAVRDSHGARTDLEAHLRTLRRSFAGTAPGFGIYVSCAGRGSALYSSPDVDVRLIEKHFPGMPLVGLHSTFELAPMAGRLTPQIYTGVLSVFCAPS